ncbi:MAG: DNA modification methylase [Candidatus Komeilibacteria bacterium]
MAKDKLSVRYIRISDLKPAVYNPRVHNKELLAQLKQSISRFGMVDPIIVNSASNRQNIVIGGHARLKALEELGHKDAPVVFVDIPDETREQELNLRLNRNVGEWDFKLLAEFDDNLLSTVGFTGAELDAIFGLDDQPEVFDLQKELDKLDIKTIEIKKGDIWQLGPHRLKCGDSTIASDMKSLMGDEKAGMCLTDPPYDLAYLNGKKKHGKATEGFGYKRDRKYLETDVLPDNFTELWMSNIAKVAQPDFSIIVYELWKNLRVIWGEMEKHWQVRNMIVWHLPNRNQGFAASRKFFSKHDIAMVGSSDGKTLQQIDEGELLENEYETALYAISGKPEWEGYKKGQKYCPTDFIEFNASDEKHSGQGVIFGTKPVEILIPYIKVLTKRNDLIVEPFGGSGSTLIAAHKMHRRCYLMEKSPIYAEVIRKRWERLTGLKATKVYGKK